MSTRKLLPRVVCARSPGAPGTAQRVRAAMLAAAGLLCAQAAPAQESPAPGGAVAQGPGLGVPAAAEEIAGWALSVLPDGTGLPPGSGTAAQGETIYRQKCLACHGEGGQGGPNDQLVGGHGTIGSDAPVKTIGSYWPYATTIFDYIRRAMPFTAPQSLTDDEVYALTAYLLELNGVIDGDVMNAQTLPQVRMPNADNFFRVWEPAGE